jgi:S-DNA-T family DNA segregation ATPase FtsK/SpoIIIE
LKNSSKNGMMYVKGVVDFMLDTSISIQKIIEDISVLNNCTGFVAPIGIKNNQIEYTDYAQINNLLVCGTTGSGKTTFVKTIIASLISINRPENFKLSIFDSVRTDYLEFSNVPNLIMPIIKDIPKCNGMLLWVLSEAQRRNALLNETATDLKLPEIFVILDDYAQVAQDKEVQKTLYELLQINHRVKIHIIIVTSISLAKIISTELKVHIPHRITFFLPEKRNSKVVIDQHGAETLRVPGQFIAKFYSEAKVYDSVELSDSDIKEACNISANRPCEHK